MVATEPTFIDGDLNMGIEMTGGSIIGMYLYIAIGGTGCIWQKAG